MTQHTEAPNNQNEEYQAKKKNKAVDHCLGTPRQQIEKKFYLNMPAYNQRHAGSKGNCHDLGKHHNINGTQEWLQKDLGPHDIGAGNHHHQ
jgi:hypothetical protein